MIDKKEAAYTLRTGIYARRKGVILMKALLVGIYAPNLTVCFIIHLVVSLQKMGSCFLSGPPLQPDSSPQCSASDRLPFGGKYVRLDEYETRTGLRLAHRLVAGKSHVPVASRASHSLDFVPASLLVLLSLPLAC